MKNCSDELYPPAIVQDVVHRLTNSSHNEISLKFLLLLSKTEMILCHPITDSSSVTQDSAKNLFKLKKIPFSAPHPILDNSLQATVTFLMLPDIFLNKICKSNLNLVSVQPRVKYWSSLSDENLKVLGTASAWWKYSCFVPFSTTHWEITLPGGPDSLPKCTSQETF